MASRAAASTAASSSPADADDAHPAPAAACGRLHEQREAELRRLAARHDRHAGLDRDPARLDLVAAGAERVRRGADPEQPGRADRLGEVAALGEEAVAGVDRVGARPQRGLDVLLRPEVRADLLALVRRARVQRAEVVGRRDRDRRDAEPARVRKTRNAISPRFATRSLRISTARQA